MTHPLDPLTAEEIRRAAAIVRRDRGAGDTWRFASIELREPAKADLPALAAQGELARREALAVCWNRADGHAYRAIVSLTGDEVTNWEHLPGQQPTPRTPTRWAWWSARPRCAPRRRAGRTTTGRPSAAGRW